MCTKGLGQTIYYIVCLTTQKYGVNVSGQRCKKDQMMQMCLTCKIVCQLDQGEIRGERSTLRGSFTSVNMPKTRMPKGRGDDYVGFLLA